MNEEKILDAIGDIDDDIIEEAERLRALPKQVFCEGRMPRGTIRRKGHTPLLSRCYRFSVFYKLFGIDCSYLSFSPGQCQRIFFIRGKLL